MKKDMKNPKKTARVAAFCLLMTMLLIIAAACSKAGNDTPTGGSASNETNVNNDIASSNGNGTAPETNAEKLSVVTSFYPLYYLASEIGGTNVEVVNLIAAGVEPHDWTPKSKDLNVASKAQLFMYHGAGLEAWVDDFLKGLSTDSKVMTKEMSVGISLITGDEEAAGDDHAHEGEHAHEDDHAHEDEHAHEDDHAHEDEHGHSHSHDTDPHTWVSPKSVLILAENVKNALVEVDPANAADYEENYAALQEKLMSLDNEYSTKLAQVSQKNIVVSHQAFGYLARDYGLTQLSIMGLSPDAEPLAQDILNISKFVKENGVKYIFFEELVSDQLASMLASEAKVDTMVLNPLEGLTKAQEKAGETFLTLMERNLQNLIQALQ